MLAEGTFDGKVAVVTGGGSGMGRAMALEFARLGAAVVVAGRRPEPLAETVALVESAGGRALAQPTDVRDPEQVDALVRARSTRFGRLDVLVNNAAGNFVVRAEDLSPNGWRAVVGIVLDGGFLCSRAAGRQDDRAGRGRRDPERPRELRLDGRAGHRPLRRGEGGPARDDAHARRRVGPARHPGQLHHPGADRHGGRRRRALADAGGARPRSPRRVPLGRFATVEEVAWWTTALCSPYAVVHHRREPRDRRRPLARAGGLHARAPASRDRSTGRFRRVHRARPGDRSWDMSRQRRGRVGPGPRKIPSSAPDTTVTGPWPWDWPESAAEVGFTACAGPLAQVRLDPALRETPRR